MIPEKILDGFITRIRGAAGSNLESIILYGSAAAGNFTPEISDINILCVLHDASFAALQTLEPVAKWWDNQKQPAPLIMASNEIEHSADVFAIEWLDMRENHRVLFGTDVLANLQIPMRLHRIQVEYELREKLIILRQGFLLSANNEKKVWELLLHSAPSFYTLFRHALIALGETPSPNKTETLQALARKIQFDSAAVVEVLELRQRKAKPSSDVKQLCARYLAAIEQVTAAVDTMMDSQS